MDNQIYIQMIPTKENQKLLRKLKIDYEIRMTDYILDYLSFYMTTKQYTHFCLRGIEHQMYEPKNEEQYGNEHYILAGLF
jgi:hypothetical protein